MSLKYFIIHLNGNHNNNPEEYIKKIEEINPDKILLLCFEEADAKSVFRNILSFLSPWLIKNNKIAKVLVPYPDNEEIAPNVITEKSFGYQHAIKTVINDLDKLNIDFTKSHTIATRPYTCYNNISKFHRALTIDLLAKENILEQGIVTMHYPRSDQIFGGKYDYQWFDQRARIDEDDFMDNRQNYSSWTMARSFLQGFVDIVTETQMDPQLLMLTEKTAKSVGTLKPFLSVSSVNFHKYIEKEYGIEPYPELFDYSFDSLPNILGRVDGVVQNIKRVIPIFNNEYEKNKIHDLLLPRMIENKKRLYNYTFDRNKMIPPSLEFVTNSNSNYQIFGDVDFLKFYIDFYKSMGWVAE